MPKGIPPLFNPSKISYYGFMILLIMGVILLVAVSWLAWRRRQYEGFDDLEQALAIGKQIQSASSDDQIKTLMGKMVNEMVAVGAFPDTSQFVRKTELPDSKCTVAKAEDSQLYQLKSACMEGPRIDMSQYIKKSAIPACPQQKCPEPVDLSGYVKKSSLFNQKQQACVCPQVKVSAGLCKECPPCPTLSCPACPVPEPAKCPPPAPCPEPPTQPVRYEVKYIKQPVLITKTVVVDSNNNVLSQSVNQDTSGINPMDIASNAGNTGFYDFINSISNGYSMIGASDNTGNTLSVSNPTSTPSITTSTTSQNTFPTATTMATAPCVNEQCLNAKDLNSSFAKSGGPQGLY